MAVVLSGITLTPLVIEWGTSIENAVAITEFVNTTDSQVDDDIWSLDIETLVLTCRVDDSTKLDLDDAAISASTHSLTDGSGATWTVWIKSLSYIYERSRNEVYPWKVEIELLISCCTGENVTNGSFEIGTLDGWNTTETPEKNSYLTYIGTYSCKLDSANEGIDQVISNVKVDDLCQAYLMMLGDYLISPPLGTEITIIITYTDTSTTEIVKETTADEGTSWVKVDILSYLTAGKTINHITIFMSNGVSECYIDAVILNYCCGCLCH